MPKSHKCFIFGTAINCTAHIKQSCSTCDCRMSAGIVEARCSPLVNRTDEPEVEEDPEPYPPWNFSWVVDNGLACMAWPQTVLNLDFLYNEGIRHLVTLCPEKIPPIEGYPKIEWTLIAVDEFADPSIKQIIQFIEICEKALQKKQPVGVHCRMGRGRCGVMAACYLVKFQKTTPERAITDIRLARPKSIETPEQERAIFKYFDYIRGTITPGINEV